MQVSIGTKLWRDKVAFVMEQTFKPFVSALAGTAGCQKTSA